QGGRYAYRNQPGIAHWNLACLAQTLVPLLHEDGEQAVALAQEAVDTFAPQFQQAHNRGMARKLGLGELTDEDTTLVEELFQIMAEQRCDFTLTFRRLADLAEPAGTATDTSAKDVSRVYELPDALLPWLARWRARLALDPADAAQRQAAMYAANPVFIPRNHLVAQAIEAAQDRGDYQPFNELVDVLADPWTFDEQLARYATPPAPEQVVRQTFCGT
ncbi:MAG: YdiU family protein, partial [Halioglobus sp.]|nr:YdiU family protein [Halioglobus sp.]